MMQIDRSLAQVIVNRSMEIIDSNVNLMDASGTIIASGEQSRVGTVHQGAVLVLSKQGAVHIDHDLAQQLEGVKPGVNLPLKAQDEIVGVIGLTGDPAEVSRYAELVCLAAETMIEQARLMQLLARDARLREELVLSLIRGEDLTPALSDWAHRLGINMAMPRVAVVIEVDSGHLSGDAALVEMQRLHSLVNTPEHNNVVATVSLTELVVLKPALNAKGEWDSKMQRQRIEKLLARMKLSSSLGLRIALGQYFPGPGGLPRSYQLARATLAVGKRRQPETTAHFYADLRLPVLLDTLRHGWQVDQLREPLGPLIAQDRQGQLLDTLVTWFAQGMQVAKTAEALRIHRNTLNYRLRRIEKLCGMDLSTTEDCIRLYLALQM